MLNKKTYYKPYSKLNNGQVKIMWDYKPFIKNIDGILVDTNLATWE